MKNREEYKHFGEFLKDLRKEKKMTLREFCKAATADPGNISRIERSVCPPPQDNAILERYALTLGLEKETDYRQLFFDLAAADCGILPQDIMEDKEVVEMLPVFFRTLRGQKPTEAEMLKLAEKIRRG